MELVTGGDLLHKITNEQADEETIKQVIKQILTNVKSLHDLGIIHRDLKPENIMVDKENQEIKFIDFGLSTFCLPLEMKKYKCGTLGYMAPEVLTGAYSKKVDIWSVGVITFAYLTGKLPFYSHSKEEILEMTQNCEPDFLSEKWMNYSEEAKSFTQALLMKSPLDRPNVEEALNHSWLKG
jgi:serine/threonine protein kinase